MAKKKRQSKPLGAETEPAAVDVGDSRKRIRSYEDVAGSDDEFHLNRDRILLEEEPAAKRRRKAQEEEAFLEASEEEVLEQSDHDDLSDDEPAGQDEDEEEEEGWGTSKADTYGADMIETEEQALEEEAEARRLQKKQLQSMSTADYGFDDEEWEDSAPTSKTAVITETLPEPEISPTATPAERLKILTARYPELAMLSKELLQLELIVEGLTTTLTRRTMMMPRAKVKHDAASAYLGALTLYFALLTSGPDGKSMSPSELHDHDIMAMLVECRVLWQRVRGLPVDDQRLESIDGAIADAETMAVSDDMAIEPSVKSTKSRKARHEEAVQAAKQARIAEKLRRLEAEDAELDLLLGPSSKKVKRSGLRDGSDGSDVGEVASLTAAQAEEKAKRRKSLRFYTSQIAQKANKRGVAGRTAGGDDDVPHRERLRDRQTRLNAEAEKRGKRGADAGDDLGGDSDDNDADQARKIRQAVDDDDEYYDMVAARAAKKKSDKLAYGETQKRAKEQGGTVVEQETVGANGKRKITYAIEKNKGLTPHRKKDVRNPRVKKRKKFEEKSKKLATMKATYKGGEGRGGYGGELTGIKANLVKSIKL